MSFNLARNAQRRLQMRRRAIRGNAFVCDTMFHAVAAWLHSINKCCVEQDSGKLPQTRPLSLAQSQGAALAARAGAAAMAEGCLV